MATGVLGLGGGGAASLNQDVIDKLREAERKAKVEPIEKRLESITQEGGEAEKLAEITAKANELLEAIKPLDLFVSGGITAFDRKSANVSGSSVIFDAVNESAINEGTTTVHIEALAQRDVYQSDVISNPDDIIAGVDANDMLVLAQDGNPTYQSNIHGVSGDDTVSSSGTLTIDVNGTAKNFTITSSMTYSDVVDMINQDEDLNAKITLSGRLEITHSDKKTSLSISGGFASAVGLGDNGEKFSTHGLSYKDLAKKINESTNYSATIESVGSNSNRLVIKSAQMGLENAINISQSGVNLNLSNTVAARDLKATVDGVEYNVASNSFVVDGGLKITAIEENAAGEFSSISVQKDNSSIEPTLKAFVTKYNELVSLVDGELFSAESKIKDKASLRSMVEGIKNQLFGSYGEDDKLSIFNFGFELDKSGALILDSKKLNEIIKDGTEDLRSLFVGKAETEDRGLGTNLKEYVDGLDRLDGLLSSYETNMNKRKASLEEEKKKAIEGLDKRYALLAQQFAAYGSIINQFEAQFSGLKLMIDQSVASG